MKNTVLYLSAQACERLQVFDNKVMNNHSLCMYLIIVHVSHLLLRSAFTLWHMVSLRDAGVNIGCFGRRGHQFFYTCKCPSCPETPEARSACEVCKPELAYQPATLERKGRFRP